MITKFTILGERCSGTNFLEQAIIKNFDIEITWQYGYKHFFGFEDYSDSDDTLFIGIVRNPYKWINSLYKTPYHLQEELKTSQKAFLANEFWSYYDDALIHSSDYGSEILFDRNIYTGDRYKNIFECRKIKCNFLLNDMPKKVKNYILIRYEDLRDKYEETLNKIKNSCMLISKYEKYVHVDIGTKTGLEFVIDEREIINKNEIIPYIDEEIEGKLGYI